MKESKETWKERAKDAALEAVVGLVLFGLGALVWGLFGGGIDALDDADGDLLILVGVAVLVVLFAVPYGIYRMVKRKKKKETE